ARGRAAPRRDQCCRGHGDSSRCGEPEAGRARAGGCGPAPDRATSTGGRTALLLRGRTFSARARLLRCGRGCVEAREGVWQRGPRGAVSSSELRGEQTGIQPLAHSRLVQVDADEDELLATIAVAWVPGSLLLGVLLQPIGPA